MTILIILLFSTISLSLGQQSPNQVRDIDGNLVRSSAKYYTLPVFRGRGGGLTLAATRNELCPLDVVQENMEVIKGLPLAFIPVNPKEGIIRESTNLNIIFSASSICIQSNVWMLVDKTDSITMLNLYSF
ncbi:proteinase inhibitor I3 [Artemisia annua]|uniref:Proteinase inhibitor I3 n=1 Tax=Artemisia annua TaxID=35608 RepID=A0A2U1P6T0_ARTAN|nr:proteinase inhibitor I3 [Artemisia annua]